MDCGWKLTSIDSTVDFNYFITFYYFTCSIPSILNSEFPSHNTNCSLSKKLLYTQSKTSQYLSFSSAKNTLLLIFSNDNDFSSLRTMWCTLYKLRTCTQSFPTFNININYFVSIVRSIMGKQDIHLKNIWNQSEFFHN